MITKGGRATPLLWKSVPTENIQRIATEDDLLARLRAANPESARITLLANRGFGNQDGYCFCGSARNRLHHPMQGVCFGGPHRR